MSTALSSSPTTHTPLASILLAAAAFALMTSIDTIFKLMTAAHPAWQILLVNGVFSVLPVAGWAYVSGGFSRLRTSRPLLHLARGSISVTSAFCAIYAYARLPLTDFYAIVFAGPLLVSALSSLWLGEKIDGGRWAAITAGFLGILIVTHPFAPHNHEASTIGRIAAGLSVFCYALSVIMIRRMRINESNLAFALYGYLAVIIIAGIMSLFLGGPPMLPGEIARLALSGTLAGTASICLMTAYHRSPVALVAPFQYTQILWGALAGWLIWRQVPDRSLLLGAAIVAVSGLYVIYKEMRIKTP